MGKVQLNSQAALHDQRKRLNHCIEEYTDRQTPWNMQQKEDFYHYMNEFSEAVFAIMKENVEVDGRSWHEASSEKDVLQPVDLQLEDELLQRQIRVNELLVEVTKCRNEIPVKVAQVLEQEKRLKYRIEVTPESQPAKNEVDYEEMYTLLQDTLPRMSRLSKTLPVMVSDIRQHTKLYATETYPKSGESDEGASQSSERLHTNIRQRSTRSGNSFA
ncbi:hypothetical protein SARC_06200 [Sphaeroforma arctica JP610]|uniref:Uncharacterized protein n=1 Tax=Sphaeroforma arctica JP610 TaxID=667725 RepID=A0A0L0FX98_9EUKA|nr:hypothetical protein SARC_06200 [Sphaeroforma arctica JP610]KNC81470.1 hypothetical protein SARC_06200 [Sphaeroforma arctica JP610]|eukprot:XP_014155372.1 hypothetical protein SARC_06200 [Sphaeroforma arctica JP610]